MNSIDLLVMAVKNLFRRKLRTFLTALGIVIGTISIVVMISMGIAMQENMKSQISQMGDITVLTVHPSYNNGGNTTGKPSGVGTKDKSKLNKLHLEELKTMENVEAVTPFMRLDSYGISSKRYELGYASIMGIDMSVADKFGLKIAEGSLPTHDDKYGLVFGSEIIYEFKKKGSSEMYMSRWDEQKREAKVDVLKEKLTLDYKNNNPESPNIPSIKVKGVGILKEGDWNTAYSVYMDINTLIKVKEDTERKLGKYDKKNQIFDQIQVKVDDIKNVEEVQKAIKDEGYQVSGMLDYVKEMEKMMKTVQMVVAGIGAISLVVAAIGITNTMVMAIYERRREIGIMKVIGAQIRDIKKLFLIEAAGIGVVGGLIGIIFSYGTSFMLNKYVAPAFGGGLGMGMEGASTKLSVIPVWLGLGTVAFTAMIGILSGYLPARKAMKLSALEAIKNE